MTVHCGAGTCHRGTRPPAAMSSPNDTEKSILATSKAFDDALATRDVSKLRGTLAAGGAVLHHGVYINSFHPAAAHPLACASVVRHALIGASTWSGSTSSSRRSLSRHLA